MTSLGTRLVLHLGSVSVGKVLPSPNRTATSHPINVQVTLRDPLRTSAESTCLARAQPSASETLTSPHATRGLPFTDQEAESLRRGGSGPGHTAMRRWAGICTQILTPHHPGASVSSTQGPTRAGLRFAKENVGRYRQILQRTGLWDNAGREQGRMWVRCTTATLSSSPHENISR